MIVYVHNTTMTATTDEIVFEFMTQLCNILKTKEYVNLWIRGDELYKIFQQMHNNLLTHQTLMKYVKKLMYKFSNFVNTTGYIFVENKIQKKTTKKRLQFYMICSYDYISNETVKFTDYKIIVDISNVCSIMTQDNALCTPIIDNLPTEINNPSNIKYTTLNQYGIPTDMTQKDTLTTVQNLIKDIVLLYKTNNLELCFQHSGNNAPGKLCSIPRAKSKETFRKAIVKSDFIESMITKLVSSRIRDNTIQTGLVSRDEGVEWILEYLGKRYDESFSNVSKKFGLVARIKMRASDATSMWSDAGVSNRAASTILTHIRHAFGYQIQVPKQLVQNVIPNINKQLPPLFGTFDHYKDNNTESNIKRKPEKVRYWVNDFCELMAKDVESIFNYGKYEGNEIHSLHTFGYPSCDVVIGSDHGAGKSRFLMKVNLLSSTLRRENVNVEYGSIVYHFGNIDCKKDTNKIHKQIHTSTRSWLN